jgi:hypothetical protein
MSSGKVKKKRGHSVFKSEHRGERGLKKKALLTCGPRNQGRLEIRKRMKPTHLTKGPTHPSIL